MKIIKQEIPIKKILQNYFDFSETEAENFIINSS